jgi:hypothetical protein
MSTDYFWTVVGWTFAAVAFFGTSALIVWGAFAPPVEDEEAAR